MSAYNCSYGTFDNNKINVHVCFLFFAVSVFLNLCVRDFDTRTISNPSYLDLDNQII